MVRPPYSARTHTYARRYAEANMLSHVSVQRPVAAVLDLDTIISTSGMRPVVYEGKARIHGVRGAGFTMLGDVAVDTRTTTVSIPWNAPLPRQDDIVLVEIDTSDLELVNKVLLVRDVDGGGLLRASRNLTCTTFAESSDWSAA